MGLGLNSAFSIRIGGGLSGGIGFNILDAVRGTFGLSDPAGISMARARDTQNPYIIPRPILPAVAPTTARSAPPEVSGQSTGVNKAPISQPVPQTFAAVGEQKLEPLVQKGKQTMSLDLGNLLGTLGSSYIQARYGTPRQPQVMAPTIRPQGPRAGVAAQPVLLETLPEMASDVYDYFFTDEQKQSLSQMPNAGKVQIDPRTGRVSVCKNRRRRKRLATTSDIKDLAALKSVLSPADLKTWIATHPS